MLVYTKFALQMVSTCTTLHPGGSASTLPDTMSDAGALVTLPLGSSVALPATCVTIGAVADEAFTGLPPGAEVHFPGRFGTCHPVSLQANPMQSIDGPCN
jgi:hypothetical protein